jgi:hypothetical protein
LLVEAIDPRVIVALDLVAAADLCLAYGQPAPQPGEAARLMGRDLVVTESLEASLEDEQLKRRVWKQLQALRGCSFAG